MSPSSPMAGAFAGPRVVHSGGRNFRPLWRFWGERPWAGGRAQIGFCKDPPKQPVAPLFTAEEQKAGPRAQLAKLEQRCKRRGPSAWRKGHPGASVSCGGPSAFKAGFCADAFPDPTASGGASGVKRPRRAGSPEGPRLRGRGDLSRWGPPPPTSELKPRPGPSGAAAQRREGSADRDAAAGAGDVPWARPQQEGLGGTWEAWGPPPRPLQGWHEALSEHHHEVALSPQTEGRRGAGGRQDPCPWDQAGDVGAVSPSAF